MNLTGKNRGGKVKVVDISDKKDVLRIAIAEGFIKLKEETLKAIEENRIKKGDVVFLKRN